MIRTTRDDELMTLECAPHPSEVWGFLEEREGRRLAMLATGTRTDRPIVEIGSLRGRSTCYLAIGAGLGWGAHIYAIDKWDPYSVSSGAGGGDQHRERFDINIARFGLRDRVTAVRADSAEVAKVWTWGIGLLFIDGGHTRQDLEADFEGFGPRVVPGGVIAIHDYTDHFAQIKAYVDEIILPSRDWADVDLCHTLLTLRTGG